MKAPTLLYHQSWEVGSDWLNIASIGGATVECPRITPRRDGIRDRDSRLYGRVFVVLLTLFSNFAHKPWHCVIEGNVEKWRRRPFILSEQHIFSNVVEFDLCLIFFFFFFFFFLIFLIFFLIFYLFNFIQQP